MKLNNQKITNTAGLDTITVNKGGVLIIDGSGCVDNITHQRAAIYNNGEVTLNGGSYTRSGEAENTTDDSGNNSYYNILNHGVMEINAGVSVTSTGHFSSLVANGYYDYNNSADPRKGYVSTVGQANPSLTINGGTFDGGLNSVKNDDGATLVIEDGTFANNTQHVIFNVNEATINGGEFGNTGNSTAVLYNRKYDDGNDKGQLTVNGGKFVATETSKVLMVYDNNTETVINGGTFSENTSVATFIPEASTLVDDGTGNFTLGINEKTCVAAIGNKGYTSLEEAVTKANAGDFITLI